MNRSIKIIIGLPVAPLHCVELRLQHRRQNPRLSYSCIPAPSASVPVLIALISSSLPGAGWEACVQAKLLLFRIRELAK